MTRRVRNVLLLWLLLVALGAAAFGGSFLPIPSSARPLLILPGIAMAAVIGFGFMELRRSDPLAPILALAALFWLSVLLGLGTMDPMTRQVYPTAAAPDQAVSAP